LSRGNTFTEGTIMVAVFPPSRTGASPLGSLTCIKVLDLLTNRYHTGIVHAASDGALDVEMPLAARLSAGQRVHFALADPAGGIIPRQAMRSALVRRVHTTAHARLRIDLTPAAECVAA
jgi:hypothetical protein